MHILKYSVAATGNEVMPERPVREILSRDALVWATPDTTVREAARRMAEHACGSVVVLDDGRLVGIFTERDLLTRVVATGRDPDHTLLREVMTLSPDWLDAGAPVKEAIRMMDECGYEHIPVVDGDRVLGVVAVRDIPVSELMAMGEELEQRHGLAERMW